MACAHFIPCGTALTGVSHTHTFACAFAEPGRLFSSLPSAIIKPRHNGGVIMADGRGFEPPLELSPKHTFQACAFNHSATHPARKNLYTF